MKSTLCAAATIVAVAVILAGCAGQPSAKQAKADQGEYEYVTPLGSNIPVRVRKGQAAPNNSPTATISGDDMQNMQRGAGGQMGQFTGKQ